MPPPASRTERCARLRISGVALSWITAAALGGCATEFIPSNPPPGFATTYPRQLTLAEPSAHEVVVIINDNTRMIHAGMFVADVLVDPAGSYLATRRRRSDWHHPSLADYVRFQLEDGPRVLLYRFTLDETAWAAMQKRIAHGGSTLPMFCAAKVQNLLSGVGPFRDLPTTWIVTPHALGQQLDRTLYAHADVGSCAWPDGTSCAPVDTAHQR